MAKVLTRNPSTGRIEELEVSTGSSYTASAEVDFGTTGTTNKEVIISAAWAGTTTSLSCRVTPNLTDHDYEDIVIERIQTVIGEIVNGVSIKVYVHAPDDTWGRYTIIVSGA